MAEAQATEMDRVGVMTLNQVGVGREVRICLLRGSGCDGLRDLGLCEQQQVRKLSDGRNLICSVCGTRLAISRQLAEQVLVVPVRSATS